jgi:hypothetical protein
MSVPEDPFDFATLLRREAVRNERPANNQGLAFNGAHHARRPKRRLRYRRVRLLPKPRQLSPAPKQHSRRATTLPGASAIKNRARPVRRQSPQFHRPLSGAHRLPAPRPRSRLQSRRARLLPKPRRLSRAPRQRSHMLTALPSASAIKSRARPVRRRSRRLRRPLNGAHRLPAPLPTQRLQHRRARLLPKPRRLPARTQRSRILTTLPSASAIRNRAMPVTRVRARPMLFPVMFARPLARSPVRSMSRNCARTRTCPSRSPCAAWSPRSFARIIPLKSREGSRKRRRPQIERRHIQRPTQRRTRSPTQSRSKVDGQGRHRYTPAGRPGPLRP